MRNVPLIVFAQLLVHAKNFETVVQAEAPLALLLVDGHAFVLLYLLLLRVIRQNARHPTKTQAKTIPGPAPQKGTHAEASDPNQ